MAISTKAVVALVEIALELEGLKRAPEVLAVGTTPETVLHRSYRVVPSTAATIIGARCVEYTRLFDIAVACRVGSDGEAFMLDDVLDLEDALVDRLAAVSEVNHVAATYEQIHEGRYIQLNLTVDVSYSRPRP